MVRLRSKKIFKKSNHKSPIKNENLDIKPYMITIKNNLNTIVKNLFPMDICFDAVERVHKIVFHTYNLLKLYYIYIFEENQKNPTFNISYPDLTTQLIGNIMNIVSYKLEKRGTLPLKNDLISSLQKFYDQYYKPLLTENDLVCRDNLQFILSYEEIDILKNIKNNISEHYISHLRFLIKIYFDFDKKMDYIKSKKLSQKEEKKEKKELYKDYDNFVNDIINVKDNNIISDKKLYNDIITLKKLYIPNKTLFCKDSIFYDIKANPLDYFPHMILLNKQLEEINNTIIKNHDPKSNQYPKIYKLFNAFPLRTSIIPKYITLDTATLISLFVENNSSYYLRNLPVCKEDLWYDYFKTNMKCFKKKGYTFNFMIKTDGVGCSIIMVRADENGNPLKPPSFEELKIFDKLNETLYIDEIKITEEMKNKRIVVNDPGKSGPICCMRQNDKYNILTSSENKYKLEGNKKDFMKNIYFEYTRGQRNNDTKKRKYDKIREEYKKQTINGETIMEIESKLSKYDSKTCNFIKFKEYLSMKIEINRILYDHYKQFIYRKLKLNTYINKRRSEDKMMNNFRTKMGAPEDILLILGDYSDNGLKGTPPSMTRGIIKIFKRHDYNPYLLDEYNTSKKSCCCVKGKMENFLPRPSFDVLEEKNGESYIVAEYKNYLVWKLVRCTICKSIHNRDHNATKNMMIIVKSILEGKGRPKRFQKSKNK